MQPFSCSFMVPQPDLRSERSRYMSRHLDQTGPNVTIGNQSGFIRLRRKLTSQLHLSLSAPHTPLRASACPGSRGFAVLVSPGQTRSRADSGSLPCHEQQRFITSALLPSLTLLPFDAIFLFLQRSPPVTLKHLFLFNTVFWVEFQFF